jgi:ABC-type transporter Mla MlaB component
MTCAHSLPAELTIYTVAEQLPQWLAWLAQSQGAGAGDPADAADAAVGGLFIDASAVAEVDGAGIQLLLSLHKALAAEDALLYLEQPSAVLRKACDALGASALLVNQGDSL